MAQSQINFEFEWQGTLYPMTPPWHLRRDQLSRLRLLQKSQPLHRQLPETPEQVLSLVTSVQNFQRSMLAIVAPDLANLGLAVSDQANAIRCYWNSIKPKSALAEVKALLR